MDKKIKEELEDYLKKKIQAEKARATIISAYQLDQQELARIKETFPQLKQYQIKNIIDEGILGGFIIKFGTKIIDLSLKGQLKNFKKMLYEIN